MLAGIGAPETSPNLQALTLWAQSEGMPAWENNWLATTLTGYGGYVVNGVGVKAYPTDPDGVGATVASLLLPAYAGVVNAFRANLGLVAIWEAVNQSPWCGGCQSGHYPVALWQASSGGLNVTTIHITPPGGTAWGQVNAADSWENVRIAANTTWPKYKVSDQWIISAIDLA